MPISKAKMWKEGREGRAITMREGIGIGIGIGWSTQY